MGMEEQRGNAHGTRAGIEAEVLVVGAGPTGLMLAGELAVAGVDVVVLERRPDRTLPGSRAMGCGARTIELLDQRGIADRFLAEGTPMQIQRFAGTSLDIGDLPARYPHGLALGQVRMEAILADWVDELPVRVLRGQAIVGIEQDAHGVDAMLEDGTRVRSQYAVGCDGGRSLVRKAAGIAFEGTDASTSYLLTEAEMPDAPPFGFTEDAQGRHAIGPHPEGGDHRVRFVMQESPARAGAEPTIDEVRAAVVAVWGQDFGLRAPTWISRFSDAARQAATYRQGRLLVAGDAAHVHSPMGGQGLNTGIGDAANLGWKLGQVVRRRSDPSLLDSYHAERHPVGAWVLQSTLAQTAASRVDPATAALRACLDELLVMDEPRRHLAGLLSGLGIRYDLGPGHPLVGWRMPDLDLETADGPTRILELLRGGRPLLVDLTDADGSGPPASDPLASETRAEVVRGRYDGAWSLPIGGGRVDPPAAVLVRPDGHVAWAGDLGDPKLDEAIDTWCGEPPAGAGAG